MPVPIYTAGGVERTMRMKCHAQEHTTMTPVRVEIRTARSGVDHADNLVIVVKERIRVLI